MAPMIRKIGMEKFQGMRLRFAKEIKTTFASFSAQEISSRSASARCGAQMPSERQEENIWSARADISEEPWSRLCPGRQVLSC